MNCMAIEHEGAILVLDCGVMFDSRGLGIDLIHADFRFLLERRESVVGLVLTHGHEDHIGATSWLLRDLDIPVWGPPYALKLVQQRISEHPFHELAKLDLRVMQTATQYAIGPFEWELFRVTHSMPDSHGLVLRTAQGNLLHTGDFKIDLDPPEGDRIDLDRIEEIADEGVRVMLSDSTNALSPGYSGGERGVETSLEELIESAKERVVVGLFASNIMRIRALLDIARHCERKVVALGRSVESHIRIAAELDVIPDPSDVLISRDKARMLPRNRLLVLATGSQGESAAALPRLAAGTHPDLALGAGDLVILSARIIPGNDRAVLELINTLERRGVHVVHRNNDSRVHVSGHAHREEQRQLIELVQPEIFLPVHGTYVHMAAHAEIAREAGVPEVFVIENGGSIEVDDDGARLGTSHEAGRIHIDHHEPVPERVIHDRSLLAQLGVVFVSLMTTAVGRLISEPQVVTRGVIDEDADQELLADLREELFDAADGIRTGDNISDELLRDVTRRAVRRFFVRELGRRPLCYVLVARTGSSSS